MKQLLFIGILFAAVLQCAAFSPPDLGAWPDEGTHYSILQDVDIEAEVLIIDNLNVVETYPDLGADKSKSHTFDTGVYTALGVGFAQQSIICRWRSSKTKYPRLQMQQYKAPIQVLIRPPSFNVFLV